MAVQSATIIVDGFAVKTSSGAQLTSPSEPVLTTHRPSLSESDLTLPCTKDSPAGARGTALALSQHSSPSAAGMHSRLWT